MKIKKQLTTILIGLTFLSSAASHAGLITRNIIGEVNFVDTGFSSNFNAGVGDAVTGNFSYEDTLLSNSGLEFIPFTDLNISIGSESITEIGNNDPLQGLEFFDGSFEGFLFDLDFAKASEDFIVFGGPGLVIDVADESFNFLNASFNALIDELAPPTAKVPEPGPIGLLALGMCLLTYSRRKYRNSSN